MRSGPVELLAGGIDELAGEDLEGVSASSLGEDLVALARQAARLQAELLRRARRWDVEKGWSVDGARSGASWLAARSDWSNAEAAATLRLARQLAELPAVESALAAGELSETKAKVIAREVHAAVDHLPPDDPRRAAELFEVGAQTIVGFAKTSSVRDLGHVMAAFRDSVDPDGGLGEWNARMARRRIQASRTYEGMVRIDALLDPESGEQFLGGLGEYDNLLWRQDQAAAQRGEPVRTAEQRRVDALGLMVGVARDQFRDLRPDDLRSDDPDDCRRGDDRDGVGGLERARVEADRQRRQRGWDATVVVDLAQLQTGDAQPGRMVSGEAVTTATAQRLLCDAAVSFVLVGEGHPLYVGRRKRAATLAQIVALIVRDGDTCACPDCPLPARFTQAHHVVAWEHGGRTDLDNLVLLCHRHHQMVHEGRWRIEMHEQRPVFHRPDGTTAPPRAPPPRLAA